MGYKNITAFVISFIQQICPDIKDFITSITSSENLYNLILNIQKYNIQYNRKEMMSKIEQFSFILYKSDDDRISLNILTFLGSLYQNDFRAVLTNLEDDQFLKVMKILEKHKFITAENYEKSVLKYYKSVAMFMLWQKPHPFF